MGIVQYVGMDVDKEKIAIAVLSGREPQRKVETVICNDGNAIRRYFQKLQSAGDLMTCYEAGCLRYEKGTSWTQPHRAWLQALDLEDPLELLTLTEYRCQVDDLEEECQRIKAGIEEIAARRSHAERAVKLKAFKGVDTLIALSLISEKSGLEPPGNRQLQ